MTFYQALTSASGTKRTDAQTSVRYERESDVGTFAFTRVFI